MFNLFVLVVPPIKFCCPPFLPTAACVPGSRGSRPALPVAWMSSVRLITIILQPRPRLHPLLQQPPPMPPQPHLPMVRVKTGTHEHHPSYRHEVDLRPHDWQCRAHVMWLPSAVKQPLHESKPEWKKTPLKLLMQYCTFQHLRVIFHLGTFCTLCLFPLYLLLSGLFHIEKTFPFMGLKPLCR